MDDDTIDSEADDSADTPLTPPLPVEVGDMIYLYRKNPNYDRWLDTIDWEELAFDEPEKFDPNIHAYDSSNYASEEEAEAALDALFKDSLEKALHAAAAARQDDESR